MVAQLVLRELNWLWVALSVQSYNRWIDPRISRGNNRNANFAASLPADGERPWLEDGARLLQALLSRAWLSLPGSTRLFWCTSFAAAMGSMPGASAQSLVHPGGTLLQLQPGYGQQWSSSPQ